MLESLPELPRERFPDSNFRAMPKTADSVHRSWASVVMGRVGEHLQGKPHTWRRMYVLEEVLQGLLLGCDMSTRLRHPLLPPKKPSLVQQCQHNVGTLQYVAFSHHREFDLRH